MSRFTIKQWRGITGISQEQLATLVGVDRSTIVRWESSKDASQEIAIKHCVKLAQAFNASVDDIIFLPDETTKCGLND